MTSLLLEELYKKYKIAELTFGTIHDKLGDAYEEFCVTVLSDDMNLQKAKSNIKPESLDYEVYLSILNCCDVTNFSDIKEIRATNKIPHRQTRGLSKTDVIITITYNDGNENKVAMSCKQSYVPKMAFAEFDVETICREVGITDERLKVLMLKHQTDKSAKYFTNAEKAELHQLLEPIRERFVRWVITGSPEKNPADIVYPTVIIKFKLKKPANRYDIKVSSGDLSLINFGSVTVEDYIHSIIYDKKGNVKKGGFGTGLAWTYATGSGGFKIQFKA